MYQTSCRLLMFWLRWIVSSVSIIVSNIFFIHLGPHGCTILVTEVVIYFILDSVYNLFHTGSLSGIELTNFKWFTKKPRQKFWGFINSFCHVFWHFLNKKKNYQENSSTLKHALVNKNKESIIESRIMRLS